MCIDILVAYSDNMLVLLSFTSIAIQLVKEIESFTVTVVRPITVL